jgi:hypothetical protein
VWQCRGVGSSHWLTITKLPRAVSAFTPCPVSQAVYDAVMGMEDVSRWRKQITTKLNIERLANWIVPPYALRKKPYTMLGYC